MTAYRAKVQWVQSADILVEGDDIEDAQKKMVEKLKQSTVIWNSNWKTDLVRVDSIDMDMTYLDALLDDIEEQRKRKCKCGGSCACGRGEVTD